MHGPTMVSITGRLLFVSGAELRVIGLLGRCIVEDIYDRNTYPRTLRLGRYGVRFQHLVLPYEELPRSEDDDVRLIPDRSLADRVRELTQVILAVPVWISFINH